MGNRTSENAYIRMLNLAYEIEGLLALLSQRDDAKTEAIRSLTLEKVDYLRSMIGSADSISSIETVPATVIEEEVEDSFPCSEINPEEFLNSDSLEKVDPELVEIEKMPEVDKTVKTTDTHNSSHSTPFYTKQSNDTQRHLTFTLNDKFRFRRELFSNNDIEFSDALNVLSSMNNLNEAEDYLYNDLCWDSSNEDVQAFIAILAEYYK